MELNKVKKNSKEWYGKKSSYEINEKERSNEDVYQMTFQSKDLIIPISTPEKVPKKKSDCDKIGGGGHGHGVSSVEHPTSYGETLMHLLKGNIGSGVFAMGDAVKNAGIIFGPSVILFLGLVCVYCQHLLLNTAAKMSRTSKLSVAPDFAETVELVFANGPERLRRYSKFAKRLVNVFLCITQIGFCCVYFVFISQNLKKVFDHYDINLDVHIHMVIVLLPIWMTSLVRNLKYLTPFSAIANVLMLTGLVITIYYLLQDLPSFSERKPIAELHQLPLFFGTALFAFEGIGLVLPLQNEMEKPKLFKRPAGVLNVGMGFVIVLYIFLGVISYLKYGDSVHGSVTLDLPQEDVLAQSVKIIISLGILLTYALQLYIPVEIMWPNVHKQLGEIKHPVMAEMIFRTVLVLVTFALAEAIPFLDKFISLVGAISSTALALILPPLLHIVTTYSLGEFNFFQLFLDVFILIIGVLGAVTGTYESITSIIHAFQQTELQ